MAAFARARRTVRKGFGQRAGVASGAVAVKPESGRTLNPIL